MKKSITFLLILFLNFLLFGQCPSSASLSNNFLSLTWTSIPNPVPSAVQVSGGSSYNTPTGSGNTRQYQRNPGNCGTFSNFTGTLNVGGNTCVYSAGILPLNF
ncbi:MAG TPA: hypothetical protein PKD85_04960 [Saprospiraceae bacterium]|nr:hypothetical protein [Saprospiraceae bacterium]